MSLIRSDWEFKPSGLAVRTVRTQSLGSSLFRFKPFKHPTSCCKFEQGLIADGLSHFLVDYVEILLAPFVELTSLQEFIE